MLDAKKEREIWRGEEEPKKRIARKLWRSNDCEDTKERTVW